MHYRYVWAFIRCYSIVFLFTGLEAAMDLEFYPLSAVFLKGVAKLPFIDEARLLREVNKVECTLTVRHVK